MYKVVIDYKTLSDEDLYFEAVTTKERRALNEAFSRFIPRVLLNTQALVGRDDAKDVAAAVMERVLLPKRIERLTSVNNYLFRVTRNTCLTYINSFSRRKRSRTVLASQPFALNSVEFGANASLTNEQASKHFTRLYAAINELLPEQREVITLFYFGGYSYKKIAQLTGFELKKVKSALQNGRIRLLNTLQQEKL